MLLRVRSSVTFWRSRCSSRMRTEAASLFLAGGLGTLEAFEVGAGAGGPDLGLEAVEFGEDWTLFEFDFGLGEIGFGLAEVGGALFGVGAVLGAIFCSTWWPRSSNLARASRARSTCWVLSKTAIRSPSLTLEPFGISLVSVMGPPCPQICGTRILEEWTACNDPGETDFAFGTCGAPEATCRRRE